MSTEVIKVELKFPGDGSYTDVTELVRHRSVVVNRRLMNHRRESVVDSFKFSLKYDSTISGKIYAATSEILCQATRDNGAGAALFNGWIPPIFSQNVGQFVEHFSMTAYDNSRELDLPIQSSFQYPATIGATAFKILDKGDTANSIVHQVLTTQGLTAATYIDASCPNILDTVEHVAAEEGRETARAFLDQLLGEYGHVFYITEDGYFSVYEWDKDTVTSSQTISSVAINPGLAIEKLNFEEDGTELEWTETESMSDALLFRERLPFSTTTGEVAFTGQDIAAGDYFPPDSDIIDIYQKYRSDWLDVPYLLRETRLENEDLSLITTSGASVTFSGDTNVAIDTQVFEPRRARVSFQNSGAGTEKIYTFEIRGTALYRKARRFVLCPDTAENPQRIRTRFIFDETRALRTGRAKSRALRFGDFRYRFPLAAELAPGTIITLQQTDPALDTVVVVLESSWSPHKPLTSYVCEGITEFSADTVEQTGAVDDSPAAVEELSEAQADTTPSFADLDDGYTAPSGGTITPTKPTVVASSSGLRAIKLHWDRQSDLTNLLYYEVQVSDDAGTTWYELNFAGLGIGTVDPAVTEWAPEILYHPGLPLDGTTDEPEAATYHYRVRRRTKQADVSAWSDTVSADASPVDTGEVTVDALSANYLEAVFANINYALTIGYAGTGTVASPVDGDRRVYIDGDEILFQEYTDGAWSSANSITLGGSSTGGEFLPQIATRWLNSPDAASISSEDNEIMPGPGEIYDFENDFENQHGIANWLDSAGTFGTASEKFGTYCLEGTASLETYRDFPNKAPMAMGMWLRSSNTAGGTGVAGASVIFGDTANGYDSFITLKINGAAGTANVTCYDDYDATTDVNDDVDSGTTSLTWYYFALSWDYDNDKVYVVFNDTIHEYTFAPNVLGNVDNMRIDLSLGSGGLGVAPMIDDLFFVRDQFVDPDIFVQHYNHGLPWRQADSLSARDLILRPGTGGAVKALDGIVAYERKPSRTVSSGTTLTKDDPRTTYANPTAGAFTINLPDPEPALEDGSIWRIECRGSGDTELINEDCEATDPPILTSDGTGNNDYLNATSVRSTWDDLAPEGSYYHVMNNTAGGTARVYFHDSSADLHGLTAGKTYSFRIRMRVDTSDGPTGAGEALFYIFDVTLGVTLAVATVTELDEWQTFTGQFTISPRTTAIRIYIHMASASSINEKIKYDDVSIWENKLVTVNGHIEGSYNIDYLLPSDGSFSEFRYDGETWREVDYHAVGSSSEGVYIRGPNRVQECFHMPLNSSGTTATWTFPGAFLSEQITLTGSSNYSSGGGVIVVFAAPSATAVVWSAIVSSTGSYLTGAYRMGLHARGFWR